MENAIFTRTTALEGAPSSRSRALAHLALGPSMLWAGRVLSGIYALFILGASVTPKLLQVPIVDEKMASWGWPPGSGLVVGIIELSCVLLYLVPRTSVLGAVLMMSVLGGAIVTHIVAQDPLFSHVLFPIYVGVFMWGGLWLRSAELRALFPLFQRN